MAKKRLNKKVAIIGSLVLLFVIMPAIIFAFLHLSRDPDKFVKDGDVAIKAARQSSDANERKDLYKEAERNYRKAYGLGKTDEIKISTLYRLADVFMDTGEWRDVLGCWTQIVRLSSSDLQARYYRLKYFYIVADTVSGMTWQEVSSQATEFIDIIEKPGEQSDVASMDTSKWELEALKQKNEDASHKLGPYLHLIRGRANLEMAQLGMVTNREETLKQAIADLEKTRQLEPANVNVYLYLAEAEITKGEIEASKGNVEAKKDGQDKALELLKQAITATNDSIEANINLLGMKHLFAQNNLVTDAQKQILAIEPEYIALGSKFGSNGDILLAIASFYSDYRLNSVYLDKAIEAIEKAIELNKSNTNYMLSAANLYYRRFNIHKNKKDLDKMIEMANKTLLFEDIQNETGPRSAIARQYKIRLNSLLANSYLGQIFNAKDQLEQSQEQELLQNAQQTVRRIEQLFGSGDDPQISKWQGLLELANAIVSKGNTGNAIQKLYKTYTQMKASGKTDPYLSYQLAKIFANSSESGATGEFLASAIQNGIELIEPEARLLYAEILIRASMWKTAIGNIDIYEQRCGISDKSRMMRIKATIGTRDLEDAEQLIQQIPEQDPNRTLFEVAILQGKIRQIRTILDQRQEKPQINEALRETPSKQQSQEKADTRSSDQLNAEIKINISMFIDYADKLLGKDPNSLGITVMSSVCDDAIRTGHLDQAKLIVDKFLKYQPDNITALFYKQLAAEPDPAKITIQKANQIRENILMNISDPTKRAISLGMFYQVSNEPNKAAEQLKKLVAVSSNAEILQTDVETRNQAAGALFDIELNQKNWETVDKIVKLAQQENLDDCSGNFFAARADLAKGKYESALANIDNSLAQRPVFGYGYMLRARINAAMGNDAAALTDIQNAATINPMDRTIMRELANQLYIRNQKLGNNISSAQLLEARGALDWALALNPGDLDLMSFYAEFISDSEPNRALALRQSLQETAPSMQNALLLARLAIRLATNSNDTQQQQALFGIAASALEKAKSYDPQNPALLENYAEYYRLTNQSQKAEQILADANETQLMWRYYIRIGKFDDARKILEKTYAANPKDVDSLKGLLFLMERIIDKKAITKYGEELLALENSADNELLLIQTYLNVGMINEADLKLSGFREKYVDDGRGLFLSSWLYLKQGRAKESIEMVNKYLEGNQNDAAAWRLRGQINLVLSEFDQAITDFKHSKTLLDTMPARVLLARAYSRTGRTEDAITELKSILDNPQATDEVRGMLEQIYMNTGREDDLKNLYTKIIEQLPESVYWHKRAAGLAGASGDFINAERLYGIALQKSTEQGRPDGDALAGYLRGILEAGKMDKLFDEAGKYIDGNLASIAYFRMAEGKLKLGDRASALQYCKTALEKAGDNTSLVMKVLEQTSELLGEQQSEQMCRQKLETQPDAFSSNWAMYSLFRFKGDYDKALEYIDKCISLTSSDQAQSVDSTMKKTEVLILSYMKTSDNNYLKKALDIYESLLVKMPNNTGILNNIAYILAENNLDLDKALKYIKKTYDIKPEDPTYLDTYAFVLSKKGLYAEAVQFGQAAIQQYEAQNIPASIDVYEHLGQAQEKLGETTQAIAAYKQAIEVGGANMAQPVKERITAAIDRLKN